MSSLTRRTLSLQERTRERPSGPRNPGPEGAEDENVLLQASQFKEYYIKRFIYVY